MLCVSPREFLQTSLLGRCRYAEPQPSLRILDRMLLHDQPLVAAFLERPHELVRDVRVIRKRKLGRHETAHPAQRLPSENRREMVLPGPNVQPEILGRCGRRDGVAPRGAEKLHAAPVARVAGNRLKRVQDVPGAHLLEPGQESTRIVQGKPWLLALTYQLRDELPRSPITPTVNAGIVPVLLVGALHHELQVAHKRVLPRVCAASRTARRDKWLVHV